MASGKPELKPQHGIRACMVHHRNCVSKIHLHFFMTYTVTHLRTGLGEATVVAALERGDKVIATARDKEKLKHLAEAGASTFTLDVTDNLDNLKEIVATAMDVYGHIDVLVNNAAFISIGALEECTPEETLEMYK